MEAEAVAKHGKQQQPSWEYTYQNGGYGMAQGGYSEFARSADDAFAGGFEADYHMGGQDLSGFSREAYVGNSRKAKKSRKRGGAGKAVKGIVAALVLVVAVIVVGVGAYAWTFDNHLHNGFSTPDTISQALTPAKEGEPYYILLLGSDWRENSGTSKLEENSGDQQRSDVIILARMDAANKLVTLVSIPRDTRWYHDGTVSKINEAYNIGGATLETQAIAELTGVPISHTVETHFSGLQDLVDALGGVEVDVPQTIKYKDALTGERVTVEAGRQKLNGQEAQIFARVRKAYSGQDAARQGNVRTLVLAIADTMRQKPIFELPGLGLKVADCLGSDMGIMDFVNLAKDFGSGGLTLYSGTGPTAGEIDESAGGLWLCYDNPEGWKQVMEAVDAGEDPSKIDPDAALQPAEEEYYPYDEYGNYIGDYSEYGDYGY